MEVPDLFDPVVDQAWDMMRHNVYNFGDCFRSPITATKYTLGLTLKHLPAKQSNLLKQCIHYLQCNNRDEYLKHYYGFNDDLPLPYRQAADRIEQFFTYQGYSTFQQKLVANELWNWITRRTGKRATLRLYGPPSTGKTTIAACIMRPWHTAIINTMQSVKNPNFMLQHTVGKSLILMEEPYFTIDVAEEMKKLMAANECQTDTKHGEMCTILNIPTLITMNGTQFGHGLLPEHTECALATRCITLRIGKDFSKGHEVIGQLTHQGFYTWLYLNKNAES
jgi:Parvovirus non-structural protein NS1